MFREGRSGRRDRLPGLRLSHKVTLAIVVAMLPLVALGTMLWSSTGRLYRQQLDQNLGLISQIEADYVAGRIDRASSDIAEFAQSSPARDIVIANNSPSAATETAARDAVNGAWESLGTSDGLLGMAVVDGASEVLGAVGRATEPATRGLVRLIPPGDDSYVGDGFVANDTTVLGIVAPISGAEGSPLYVVSEWDLAALIDRDSDLDAVGASVSASLLQQESIGRYSVLVSTTGLGPGDVVDVATLPGPARASVEANNDGPEPTIDALALVSGTDWLFRVSADEAEVYAALGELELRVAQTLFIGGIILLAVMATVLRSFSTRLVRIAGLAESVTDGDLSVRLDDNSGDEIGELSRAFDRMTNALQVDIDRREAVEAQLAYQASHDALTGLPNRTEMLSYLEGMLKSNDQIVSVLFVDLDGFKEVNDTMGHDAGDELLVAVGERLRHSLRPTDFVGRLGGDEFVVVLPGTPTDAAERMATQIVQTLELPFLVQNETAAISASIGVASSNDNPDSDELIKQADIAMYRAKSMGKGRAVRVTAEALAEIDARAETQAALRQSLTDDELSLRYSPVALLNDSSLRGFTVSAGWTHPSEGEMDPRAFRALADKIGFGGRVDAWTVQRAISEFGGLADSGLMVSDLHIEIPLSVSTFVSPRYSSLVPDACDDAGVSPANVRVAVPESVLRQDHKMLRSAFSVYRRAGIGVSIHRFGSDIADLDQLAQFGLHGVQIDMDRLDGRARRETTEVSIRSMVDLARRVGLEVSACGVDNESERADALSFGATEGEGRWFSSALSPEQASQLLANRYLVEF